MLEDVFCSFVCLVENSKLNIFVGSVCLAHGSHGLTTYKELCSLASDLNQPDLVYKFMNLANHHAMWNSRKVPCSCIILTNLFSGQHTCQFSFHLLNLSFHPT